MASMHDETKKAGIPAISQQQFADDNRGHQTSSGPFSKKTKQALENQRKEAILSLSPSTSNVNKAVRYGLNLVLPGAGNFYSSNVDKNAMGYGNYKSKIQRKINRKKYEELLKQNNINNGNDNYSTILPYPYNTQPEKEDVVEEEEIKYIFGDPNENQAADVTRGSYIFNQGGRVPRAFGGIMDTATGRKAYGLGSIFKSIGKAAKKVLSSDIGKAAIAGAAFYYGGGGKNVFNTGTDGNWMSGLGKMGSHFFSKANPLLFNADEELSLSKLAGVSTVLPYLFGEAKQDPSLMASRKDSRLIDPLTKKEATPAEMRENIELAKLEAGDDPVKLDALNQAYNNMLFTTKPYENYGIYAAANGGRIGFAFGGQPLPHDPTKPVNPFAPKPTGPVLPNRAGGYDKQRVMAEEGGLMNLGGMEKDYRAEGGFVPIGKQEKADDVPARLSVNEFVFTADAVRNAGGGDIDKGAEVMENMMKNLEKGGRVSEESQGNTGAQEMFSVSERIGEVI